MERDRHPGMGWLRDAPDFRDVSPAQGPPAGVELVAGEPEAPELLGKLGVATPAGEASLGQPIDLRADFPPIESQGRLNSCTANAAVALVEYFERKASGNYVDASRLFLYKATRNLMGLTEDHGAYLRTTMQAMVLFGVPPESYWPYDAARVGDEPSAFCYAFGQNYKAIQYYRLDPAGTSRDELVARIKTQLAAGLPPMFGFTVYSSIDQAWDNGGLIPFPVPGDSREGGHAVVAVGYDDAKEIANARGGVPTTGALLIRNSWGEDWGQDGYGWLPLEYVHRGLAVDWWSLIRSSWVDSGAFGA